MILEARAENCFSSTFVIKVNGQAVGKFTGRWFGEGLDVSMLGQRRLKFEKAGWIGSHFRLKSADDDRVIAEAQKAGLFTSAWELQLSVGQAYLERAGWFDSGWVLRRHQPLARVERLGMCERGWRVQTYTDLEAYDILLTGLVFQVIQSRQQQQHHAPHMGS